MKLIIDNQRKVRIEMLPLIDVVFLLLVFFIYAILSMSVHRGMGVNLPGSSSTEIETKQTLTVAIQADGSVFVDTIPVAKGDLRKTLESMILNETQPGVLLFADKQLPYQQVFSAMDAIRQAGIQQLSLQADQVVDQ